MDDKGDEKSKSRPRSMKELWDDAERRFLRDTGMELRSKGKTSFDECLAKISKLQEPPGVDEPAGKPSGVEKAKEVGLSVLSFLKLLGGVAAQAADMTFPASGLVTNAVLFLLDIPADLHEFHKAVDGLFETLGEGLSHFRIYDKIEQFNKIDDELIETIHRLLISFVTVCGLSINLRQSGRWKKFKGDAKRIIFRDDSGVKEEVDTFNALLGTHQRVQGTQTLKVVLETNDRVAKVLNKASETNQKIDELMVLVVDIKDTADKQKAEKERETTIKSIKEKLELADNERDTSALRASQDMSDKLWHERLPGTISWVDNPDEQSEFHQWAERKQTGAKPLFVLIGDSNTGKSVIASSIINRLRNIYASPTRKLEQTYIASYFFPLIVAKSDSEKRPIHTALRCLAVQLAEADSKYATHLLKDCNAKPDIKSFLKSATCTDLWTFLRLGMPNGKTTYYFVIDGLGSLPEEFQSDRAEIFGLLDNLRTASRTVRALVTLKPDKGESTFEEASYWSLQTREIGKSDISLYIESSLKDDDILQGEDQYRKEKRGEIRDRLFNELSGNYFKVKTALEKIRAIVRKTGRWEDIVKVLDEANEDEKSISAKAIRDLESSLEPQEIDELNELLIWTAYARGQPFNLNELEDALLLRFKTPSLLKLEKKIRGKYSKIFEISGGTNVIIREDILDLVRKERTSQRRQDDEAKFSVSVTITKANLTSVQRFLWNLSMKLEATQDNFGFQQLGDKATMHGTIQVNEFDSYMSILNKTFSVLSDESNQSIQSFSTYLIAWLPDHLAALRDAPTEQPLTLAEKQSIGDGLSSLFTTGDVVEKHWSNLGSTIWNRNKDELDTFLKWLREEEVISKLGRRDRKWLREVTASQNPYRALLMEVMKMVAKNLFRSREWDIDRPYNWIRDFLTLDLRDFVQEDEQNVASQANLNEEQARIHRLNQEHNEDIPKLVSAWSLEVLGIQEPDNCWNERLAEIYYVEDKSEKVIALLKDVPEQDNPNTKSLEVLAEANGRIDDEEHRIEACRVMELALEQHRKDETPEQVRMARDYSLLAGWYTKLSKLDKTIDRLREALVLDTGNYDARYALFFAVLNKDGDEEEALKLLHELIEQPSRIPLDGTQYGQMTQVLLDIVSSAWGGRSEDGADTGFAKLFLAVYTRAPEFAGLILQELDCAIERETDERMNRALLFYRGLAISPLHFNMDAKASVKLSVDYWAECGKTDYLTWSQRASSFTAAHHFEGAMRIWKEKELGEAAITRREEHVGVLKKMIGTQRESNLSPAKCYLACYYATTDQPDAARNVMREAIDLAFDMLSDETSSNDANAWAVLGYILMACGHTIDASSAVSLLAPPPSGTNILSWMLDFEQGSSEASLAAELIKKMESSMASGANEDAELAQSLINLPGQLHYVYRTLDEMDETTPDSAPTTTRIRDAIHPFKRWMEGDEYSFYHWWCDGCRKKWDFENGLSLCRCCHEFAFCDDCVKKLKSENERLTLPIPSMVCNAGHDLLVMPPWGKEGILEALRGNVLVGGTIQDDGRRLGGEYVPINQWLAVLKSQWGYVEKEKTDSEAEPSEVGEPVEEGDGKSEIATQVEEVPNAEEHVKQVENDSKVEAVATASVEVNVAA
ncbi:Nacht and tpr domain protein [Rhypophila decipiens]|uniref:Nacht and tpr domain protein n=1 Tax=Rhypophila decipiens TaxID=261697 RepID=A0AAN7B9I4_9PEZI|nr:Nacht and tpr domain protein [Rhypophila decipiens]